MQPDQRDQDQINHFALRIGFATGIVMTTITTPNAILMVTIVALREVPGILFARIASAKPPRHKLQKKERPQYSPQKWNAVD